MNEGTYRYYQAVMSLEAAIRSEMRLRALNQDMEVALQHMMDSYDLDLDTEEEALTFIRILEKVAASVPWHADQRHPHGVVADGRQSADHDCGGGELEEHQAGLPGHRRPCDAGAAARSRAVPLPSMGVQEPPQIGRPVRGESEAAVPSRSLPSGATAQVPEGTD